MTNWTDGSGTARYWLLRLLLAELAPGFTIVNTTTTVAGGGGGADPFCGSIINLANLSLACVDPSATISKIEFASYGTPTGSCPNYAVGSCNSPNSAALVEAACVGQNSCTVPADFQPDPCFGTVKYLKVVAHCSSGGGYQPGIPPPVHAQAFVAPDGTRKVLVINKTPSPHVAALPGATGGVANTIDEATGFGPARVETLAADAVTLAPYAVVLVVMP
jgi:hypothetical protein